MKTSLRIRNARLSLSQKLGYTISQKEFGQMCGWGNAQSRQSNYETDRRSPSLEDLLKIIHVSGASPSEFFEDGDLKGINMKHVEKAFSAVQDVTGIPRNMKKTKQFTDIDNAVEPFLISALSPSHAGRDIPEFGVVKADRDTKIIKKGDKLCIDAGQKRIDKRGWWLLRIGTEAVYTHCVVTPNGEIKSDDFGVLESPKVLGRVISHLRLI